MRRSIRCHRWVVLRGVHRDVSSWAVQLGRGDIVHAVSRYSAAAPIHVGSVRVWVPADPLDAVGVILCVRNIHPDCVRAAGYYGATIGLTRATCTAACTYGVQLCD